MMRLVSALILGISAWLTTASPAGALGCVLACSCDVVASDIEFGAFNPLLGGTHDAEGEIDIDCTGLLSIGAGVVVQLDDGQWGTFSTRKMRSAAGDLLNYNIYTSAARTSVWGDGTLGSVSLTVAGGLISLGHWSATRGLYGRMNLTPAAKPGEYEDVVVVRVIW